MMLVVLHAVQIRSPLRLNTDAVRLLAMAVSADEGHGFLVNGKTDVLPPGYPAFVCALMKLGLGDAFWINAADLLATLAACGLFYAILNGVAEIPSPARLLLAVLPLGSWVCIKHLPIPLTESLYSALSIACIAVLVLCWYSRTAATQIAFFIIALGLAWAATNVRTVGVSLFPAALLTLARHPTIFPGLKRAFLNARRGWLVLGSMAIFCATIGAWVIITRGGSNFFQNGYLQVWHGSLRKGLGALVGAIITSRIEEFGEIFSNLPASKFAFLIWLFFVIGAVAIIICALGWWLLLRRLPPLAFYIGFYTAILWCWPGHDARFWMPLLPMLGLCAWMGVERAWNARWVQVATLAYVFVFVTLGIVALIYSARLSLAGPQWFADTYGDGTYRASYLEAFGVRDRQIDPAAVDPDVVRLLQRFEPRARIKL
jgi:hypothetical protein